MRRFVCVALASAFAVAPLAAFADDAGPGLAAVRAKIKAVRGTEPDNYREVITATSADGSVTTFTTFKFGKNVRYTTDAGPIHTETGTIGGEDWNQNANGITVVEEPDPNAPPAPKDDAGLETDTATMRATDTSLDGFVISDIDRDGDGTRRYVDRNSFTTMRSERVRGGSVTATTNYEEYAPFCGQTLAARWNVVRTSGATTKYTRVECAPNAVSAAQIVEPGSRRILVDFPDDKPVEIPSHNHAGEYFIRASIGGRPVEFLLDSGSSDILIDTDVAKRLGLPLTNHQVGVNAAPADFYSTKVSEISLGPVKMHDIVVSTGPVRFHETWNTDVVGLLGFDFLATIGLTIDNDHHRLIATPLTAYKPPSGPNVVPLDIRLGTHTPQVTVALDKVIADRFVVDTGDELGTYTVYDYFMNRHPHVGERSNEYGIGTGIGGHFTANGFYVHSFRLGTFNLTDFDGVRIGRGSYPQPEDGTIGTLFLLLFNVDFDYPHGRMYLTPTIDTQRQLPAKKS